MSHNPNCVYYCDTAGQCLAGLEIDRLRSELAEMKSDLENAKAQAVEVEPNYPWDHNSFAPMSQIAWALSQGLKGTRDACADLHVKLAEKEKQIDSLTAEFCRVNLDWANTWSTVKQALTAKERECEELHKIVNHSIPGGKE